MTVASMARRLPAPAPMRRAWAGVAAVDVYLRRRGFDGPQPLAPGPMVLELVAIRDSEDTPWRALDPPYDLIQTTNPSGVRVLYGTMRPGTDAPAQRIPPAIYRLRLVAVGFQSVEHELDLRQASDMPPSLLALDLLPGPDYPFPAGSPVPGLRGPTLLRGGVLHPDGRGWPGVTVSILGFVTPDGLGRTVTGDDGQWVLPLVGGLPIVEPVVVELRWPPEDHEPTVRLEVEIAPGQTNVLPQTSLRGRVVDPRGIPVVGAVLTVTDLENGKTFPGSGVSDYSGVWSYVFPLALAHDWTIGPRVRVVAESPGGGGAEHEAQVEPGVSVAVPTLRTSE